MAVYHHPISARETRAHKKLKKLFHHFMAAFHILVDMPPALCENSDSRPISFCPFSSPWGDAAERRAKSRRPSPGRPRERA